MKRLAPFAMLLLVLVTGCDGSGVEDGKVVEEVNPASGLSRWHTEGQDFSLELVPLTPDFVRAVYEAKGLPKEVIEAVSSYCVFGTIVRNRAAEALSYDTTDWRYVTADGVEHVAKPKSEWVSEWREMGIAFRWTLLPEAQTYQVGDWGQGFTTVRLPHGTAFDLHYSWMQHDKKHTAVIKGMRCAPATLDN